MTTGWSIFYRLYNPGLPDWLSRANFGRFYLFLKCIFNELRIPFRLTILKYTDCKRNQFYPGTLSLNKLLGDRGVKVIPLNVGEFDFIECEWHTGVFSPTNRSLICVCKVFLVPCLHGGANMCKKGLVRKRFKIVNVLVYTQRVIIICAWFICGCIKQRNW